MTRDELESLVGNFARWQFDYAYGKATHIWEGYVKMRKERRDDGRQAILDAFDRLTAQRDALAALLKQARDALDHPGQHRREAWAAMYAIEAALEELEG